jgi:hypothetical protein
MSEPQPSGSFALGPYADSDDLDDAPRGAAHELDLVSLCAGLLAAVPALLYLLGELFGTRVSGAVVAAVLAVALGLAGLVTAARRSGRD